MKHLLLFLTLLTAALAPLHAAPLVGNTITADGTYTITTFPGKVYTFAASGNFGGGSLAINWRDDNGNSGAYANSPAAAVENWTFTAATKTLDLILTGSSTPNISVTIAPAEGNAGILQTVADLQAIVDDIDQEGVSESELEAAVSGMAAVDGSNIAAPNTFRGNLGLDMTYQRSLEASPLPRPDTNYFFDGDSLSEDLLFGDSWPERLMALPWTQNGPYTKYNIAVYGSYITGTNDRYTSDIYPLRPSESGKPGYYFLWVGANDLSGYTDGTATNFVTQLETRWKAAKADGFKVVAFTVMQRTDQLAKESVRALINAGIRRSSEYDILVDVDTLFPVGGTADTTNFRDDVHLNDTGRDKLAYFVNTVLTNEAAHADRMLQNRRKMVVNLGLGASMASANLAAPYGDKSGTGTAVSSVSNSLVGGGATSGGYGFHRLGNYLNMSPGSRGVIKFNQSISMSITILVSYQGTLGEARWQWPVPNNQTTGPLVNKGFGFFQVADKMYGQAHDGTTLRTTTAFAPLTTTHSASLYALSDGRTVSFWVDGMPLGSLIGPTGDLSISTGTPQAISVAEAKETGSFYIHAATQNWVMESW